MFPLSDDNPTLHTPIMTWLILGAMFAVWLVVQGGGLPGNDFVLIARPATLDRDYQALVTDLVAGLKRLKLYRSEPR